MNKIQRHEAAQRRVRDALRSYGWTVLSLSTTAPADLIALRSGDPDSPDPQVLLIEVKTGKGRLTRDQRALKKQHPGLFVEVRWKDKQWVVTGKQGEIVDDALCGRIEGEFVREDRP